MPLYFTLMAASMGLQQLKTWQDNKQKDALTEKQMEMRKAVQQREFNRARRLQAEASKIAMEMEEEVHNQRRKDIENEYDDVFNSLIEQFQLDKWPLTVVPFIMKGESFGLHVRGFDVATVHCILTPSNDFNFNRFVYSSLDLRVEQMMNTHWNSNNTHHVVYYGGSWKPKAPNGVPTLDYNDVDKLHVELKSIPVICITPYFLPNGNMIFRVWAWGMGTERATRQDIAPHAKDFSLPLNTSSFVKQKEEIQEDEFNSSVDAFISEMANYLTMMIGVITDMYYWKMYNVPPLCLSLNSNLFPSMSLKPDLIMDYKNILNESITLDMAQGIKMNNVLRYYSRIKPYLDNVSSSELIDKAYDTFLASKGFNSENISEINFVIEDDDIFSLEIFSKSSEKYKYLNSIIEDSKNQIACNTIAAGSNISTLDLLVIGYELFDNSANSNRIQFNIGVNGTFIALLDSDNNPINDKVNPQCIYVEYEILMPNDRILIKSNSFILSRQRLKDILTKFSAI